ncbi:MAG: hypothetical protein HY906_24945 [Deltaproteobacteria bacterium]|nr:hypothetical protein [Deltaproteobacteria bacterium]
MSAEALIEDLSGEAAQAVRTLLVKAYERGFREALATAGQPPPARDVTACTPPPTPIVAPVIWDGHRADTAGQDAGGSVEEDGADEEPAEDEAEETARPPVAGPIMPHATVGTLRKRIVRTFDLERFDIDVVICRRGDRERRQLKATAKLGLYRREEQ